MTNHCKVISAGTSFPNSPESDLQPQVMHDVHVALPDGQQVTVRLLARDPLVAGERIRAMTDEQVAALPRAPSV